MKNRAGLGTPITWMTSGGPEVDVGREGSALEYMNNILLHHRACPLLPGKTPDVHKITSTRLTGKKLALRFIASVLLIGHCSLYVHLASTWHHSRDRCSQAFPLPCIILNTNRRTKNRGGLGTRLGFIDAQRDDESTYPVLMNLTLNRIREVPLYPVNVDKVRELATRVSVFAEKLNSILLCIFASLHLKCCITELLHRAGFV